jgi:hypothetical protein
VTCGSSRLTVEKGSQQISLGQYPGQTLVFIGYRDDHRVRGGRKQGRNLADRGGGLHTGKLTAHDLSDHIRLIGMTAQGRA